MKKLVPLLFLLVSLLPGCVVEPETVFPDAVKGTLPRFAANYTQAGTEAWLNIRTTTAQILGPDAEILEAWSVEADFRPFKRPTHSEFHQWRWLLDGQGSVIRFDRRCGYDNLDECERAFAHYDAAGHVAPFGLSLPGFGFPTKHIVGGIEAPLPIVPLGRNVFQVGNESTSDWPLLSTPYVVAYDESGIPTQLRFQYGRQAPNIYRLERASIQVDGALPPVAVQPAPLLSNLRGGGKPPLPFSGAEETAFGSDVTYKQAFDHFMESKPEAKDWLERGCLWIFFYSSKGGETYLPVDSLNASVATSDLEQFQVAFALDDGTFQSWRFSRKHELVMGNSWTDLEKGQDYQPRPDPCQTWHESPVPKLSLMQAIRKVEAWNLPDIGAIDFAGVDYWGENAWGLYHVDAGLYTLGTSRGTVRSGGGLAVTFPYHIRFHADTARLKDLDLPVTALAYLDAGKAS